MLAEDVKIGDTEGSVEEGAAEAKGGEDEALGSALQGATTIVHIEETKEDRYAASGGGYAGAGRSHGAGGGSPGSAEASLQECPVCYDAPRTTVRIRECGHRFCVECAADAVKALVAEGCRCRAEVVCLEAECGARVADEEVRDWLRRAGEEPSVWTKYSKFTCARRVARARDLVFCPKPDCGGVATIKAASTRPLSVDDGAANEEVRQAACPECSFRFCASCKSAWDEVEGQHYCVLDDGVREYAREAGMKQCPRCRVWVERGDNTGRGCAQMRCSACHWMFCWYCLAPLNDDMLLLHFSGGKCANSGGDLGHSTRQLCCYRCQVVSTMIFAFILGIVCLVPALVFGFIYCIMLIVAECFGCSEAVQLKPRKAEHAPTSGVTKPDDAPTAQP